MDFAKKKLIGKSHKIKAGKETLNVKFTGQSVKSVLRKPHKHKVEKMRLLTEVQQLFKNAKFIKSAEETKGRTNRYERWYYFEFDLKAEVKTIS